MGKGIDHCNTSKVTAHGCVRGSLHQRMINHTAIFRTRRQDSLDYCDDVHVHDYRGIPTRDPDLASAVAIIDDNSIEGHKYVLRRIQTMYYAFLAITPRGGATELP
jgi:hypothetical protein